MENMALPDISGLLDIAPTMLKNLPQILGGLQIFYYIILILMFGSVIMKGYKGYMRFWMKFLLRLGFGFVALVTGIGISNLIPMFTNDMFYTFLQTMLINPVLGIIVSTAVITVSLFMISHNVFNIPGIHKQIKKLEEKLKKAEDIAEKAGSAGIKKLEPIRIVGIIVLVAFLIVSLLNFQGFPSFGDDLFSFIGITPEDIDELGQYIDKIPGSTDIPENCVPILSLIESNYNRIMTDSLPESTDIGIKAMIESGSGMTIQKVFEITYEERTLYLGVERDNLCSATASEFCECFDLKTFMP